jgi:hypothetical protein
MLKFQAPLHETVGIKGITDEVIAHLVTLLQSTRTQPRPPTIATASESSSIHTDSTSRTSSVHSLT